MYLAGVLPLAAGLGLRPRRRGFLIAAAVIALGIALSGSRGAWAGAAIGMLALYAAVARLRASVIAGGLFGAAALVGFAFLLPREWILGRFDLTDWSTQQRLLILLTAWDGITRSPLLGYGPGSFEAMLPGIARPGLLDDVATPHNVLLHIWFEHGLAALLCFTVLLAAYACTTLRAARRTRDPRLAGLFGGVLGMIAAAMFGTLFIRGVQETFILLIAITAALLHGSLVSRGVSGHANPVSV
jgi:O-antigen ligase